MRTAGAAEDSAEVSNSSSLSTIWYNCHCPGLTPQQGHWYLRLPLLLLLNNEESEPLCRSSPSPDPGARREEPVGRWRREPGASPEHLGYLMTKTRCITWSPWIMITRTMVGCKWSKDDNGDNNDQEKIRYPKPLQKKIDEAHVPQFQAPYPLPCRRRRTDYNTLHSSLNTSNNREKDQTAIFELAQRVGREYNNHNLHIRLQGLQQPHSPCFHSAILTQNALNFLVKGKGP